MTSHGPSVSVIICAYSDERKSQLRRAIASVMVQEYQAHEIIVVIDNNPDLAEHVAASSGSATVIPNTGIRGLSGARNSGVKQAQGEILAFLDDDAAAEPDWLRQMVSHYADASVVGVGGRVIPMWQTGRPRWLPEEFHWVVGCSYRGQPEALAPVRNPIGCNMSFRRSLFDKVGGFREGIGRTAADAAGCEETELCIRARQMLPGSIILYDPAASVHHQVTAERSRWGYFRRRCVAEGRSKMMVVDRVGAPDGLSSEHRYVTRVLPVGVMRYVGDALFRRDPWGIARAGGICAGLGLTAAGYLGARFAGYRRQG